jgi:hypothetical protein
MLKTIHEEKSRIVALKANTNKARTWLWIPVLGLVTLEEGFCKPTQKRKNSS